MKTNARIYVMRAADGTIKLGHSKDPETRAKQVGRPVEIVHQTDVIEHVERIERIAHRVLALHGRHIRGEWFEATVADAVSAIEAAVKQAEGAELPLTGHLKHWTRKRGERKAILVKLPPKLVDEIDAYCDAQAAKPTRTAVFEAALEAFIDAHRKAKAKK